MKFTLVRNAEVTFVKLPGEISRKTEVLTTLVEVPLKGVTDFGGRNNYRETDLWKELKRLGSALEKEEQSGRSGSGVQGTDCGVATPGFHEGWEWLLCEILPFKKLINLGSGPGELASFRIMSGSVTNALVELFGNGVALQVTFVKWMRARDIPGFSTCEMKIQRGEHYACEDPKLEWDTIYFPQPRSFSGNGRVTITVCVPETIISNPAISISAAYKLMLQDGIGSDVVIKTGDGKQVKGHTCVLSTFSPVFKAMFESDMREANTHTVEMLDMSEEGIQALLAYLYCCEVTEPMSKPGVAVEMLMVGHKYAIEEVKTDMKRLILAKPNQWFDLEASVKLFHFANKLPAEDVNAKELKIKAAKALRVNLGYLNHSPTSSYTDLFKEDPESGMELCRCLCSLTTEMKELSIGKCLGVLAVGYILKKILCYLLRKLVR